MCWHSSKSMIKAKQRCSDIIILLICISTFHLLQSGLGEHIPYYIPFTAEKTDSSYYMFSLSAHPEPLMLANHLLFIHDINVYEVGIFMYNYVTQRLLQISENYFQRSRDVHDLNTRQAYDFYISFSRLQIRRFSTKIHGPEVWDSFATYMNISTSLMNFTKKLCKYLIDRNFLVTVSQFWRYVHIFDTTVNVCMCL